MQAPVGIGGKADQNNWHRPRTALIFCSVDMFEPEKYITPAQWLESHPHLRVPMGSDGLVIMEPSSSLFVFGLAALAVAIGIRAGRSCAGDGARFWWAVALVLWGIGAGIAGISYQAFSYEIKARGRDFVAWTSSWEIAYLLVSVASVNAMAVAVARGSTVGRWRIAMTGYAFVCMLAYAAIVAWGIMRGNRFLVSFELMVWLSSPAYLACLLLNARAWRRWRRPCDSRLMATWIGLGAIMAAYFAYAAAGIGEALWAHGVWFTANDVLHLGLIGWMVWLHRAVLPWVSEAPERSRSGARMAGHASRAGKRRGVHRDAAHHAGFKGGAV